MNTSGWVEMTFTETENSGKGQIFEKCRLLITEILS